MMCDKVASFHEYVDGIADHLADRFGVYCEHSDPEDHDDDAECRIDWVCGMSRNIRHFFARRMSDTSELGGSSALKRDQHIALECDNSDDDERGKLWLLVSDDGDVWITLGPHDKRPPMGPSVRVRASGSQHPPEVIRALWELCRVLGGSP